jgi:hypothetical protein
MKITDEMKQAGIAALRNAEATHEAAKLPDGALGRYVPWIEHAAVSVIEAVLTAAPASAAEPVAWTDAFELASLDHPDNEQGSALIFKKAVAERIAQGELIPLYAGPEVTP